MPSRLDALESVFPWSFGGELLVKVGECEAFSFTLEVFDREGGAGLFVGPVNVDETVVDGSGVGARDPVKGWIVGASSVGHAASSHFIKLEGEVAEVMGDLTYFAEVAVTAEEDGGAGFTGAEEF
mgnify:CR=1 FL=1